MAVQRPIYIVLRQSPNWVLQTYADLEKTREFCRNIGRPETLIIDRVRLWDRTFDIPFFETRQIMKEISLENLRAVAGAVLVPLADVRDVLKPDAFYLFIDDDDWYRPDIAQVLQNIDPGKCAAVHWDAVVSSKGITFMRDGIYWTNNYAVSGSYLLQRKQNLEVVSQHYRADGAFRARFRAIHRRMGYKTLIQHLLLPGYRIQRHLDAHLSADNKHPASTIVLEELGDYPTEIQLRSFVQAFVESRRGLVLPPEMQWTKQFADKVVLFCSRLVDA